MPLPKPPSLFGKDAVLLLDFDGTLVELVDRPDAIVIDQDLLPTVGRLMQIFDRRLAVVSGRSVAQIEGFLGDALAQGAIIGSHGGELKIDQGLISPQRPDALAQAENLLNQAFADQPGVIVEVKSLGVAVHFRTAPDTEPDIRHLITRIAADAGLAIQEGKMMIELRTPGHDKGSGITALMQQAPFAGHRPIFLGDDVTDEAGFSAVAELGGWSVLVGPERPTAAQYRLDDVAAVRAWLADAA